MAQLRKLAELRDAGILTPEEFDAKKTEILGRMQRLEAQGPVPLSAACPQDSENSGQHCLGTSLPGWA
ncbi:MAG: SHOCT domain-containing protein [Nocardioidaceae bacterium]|nr:SHOCT domain-containing protein [Nocardioidaceae bacterium]